MNPQFAEWYRQAHLDPQDELLRKRWQGVEAAAASTSDGNIQETVRLFFDLKPTAPDFENGFRTHFQNADTAFRMSGNAVELRVLAGATLAQVMDQSNIADLAALALICPTLEGRGRKSPLPAIQDYAERHLLKHASSVRTKVNGLGQPTTIPEIEKQRADGISITNYAAAAPHVSAHFQDIMSYLQTLAASVRELNSAVLSYQEESDVLWWLTGGHSRDLHKSFVEMDLSAASIVAGKELADLTITATVLYAAPALLHRLLSCHKDFSKEIGIGSAIDAVADAWLEGIPDPPESVRGLCPMLMGLSERRHRGKAGWMAMFEQLTGVAPIARVTASTLARQVYREYRLVGLAQRGKR